MYKFTISMYNILVMINSNSSLRNALNLFIDKYKIEILHHLLKKQMGFNELKNTIGKINQQILSKQLKQLLKDGLISKVAFKEFPKRPMYTSTKFGKTLKPILNSIIKWEVANTKEINKVRKRNNRVSLYNYY